MDTLPRDLWPRTLSRRRSRSDGSPHGDRVLPDRMTHMTHFQSPAPRHRFVVGGALRRAPVEVTLVAVRVLQLLALVGGAALVATTVAAAAEADGGRISVYFVQGEQLAPVTRPGTTGLD